MNIWLCPVKPRSWRIIKSNKLYGVPKRALKLFCRIQPGDLLVFHVLKPINGIVSVCKVTSEVFENHQDIWGRGRYPFRVKIEFIQHFTRNKEKPIPLSSVCGKINSQRGIIIEPYLKNVWITRISKNQYHRLTNLFANKTKQQHK